MKKLTSSIALTLSRTLRPLGMSSRPSVLSFTKPASLALVFLTSAYGGGSGDTEDTPKSYLGNRLR